ncbi:uncharacterized protein VTP21DRAFT_9435 [Calcarisporiella thermophila]|uniref:uncharacterized protein n=1 Tax=Calcarisporiella thermophila TaxID=911321 RepID=UPI003742F5FD
MTIDNESVEYNSPDIGAKRIEKLSPEKASMELPPIENSLDKIKGMKGNQEQSTRISTSGTEKPIIYTRGLISTDATFERVISAGENTQGKGTGSLLNEDCKQNHIAQDLPTDYNQDNVGNIKNAGDEEWRRVTSLHEVSLHDDAPNPFSLTIECPVDTADTSSISSFPFHAPLTPTSPICASPISEFPPKLQRSNSFIEGLRSTFSFRRASTFGNVDMMLARIEVQTIELEKDPRGKEICMKLQEGIQANFDRVRTEAVLEGIQDEVDWDFWGQLISDFDNVIKTQPKKVTEVVRLGIPPSIRGMIWQLFSKSKDPELETTYAELIKQQSPYDKMIERDISRTFPDHEYFKLKDGPGQVGLFNVLRAYSLYDEEIGYCQGLAFVVGPLLLNMPEEETFCLLIRLVSHYGLRDLFTPDMAGLNLRLFQFDRLLEDHLPHVFRHLMRKNVRSTMFAAQWFMTLFAYKFPMDLVLRIFDVIMVEGVDAVFRFAIALMKRGERDILGLEFEQLVEFLKIGLFEFYPNANELVSDAYNISITTKQLKRLAKAYTVELKKAAQEHQQLFVLKQANSQLAAHIKRLEASLDALNSEHCTLTNELITTKMQLAHTQEENESLDARCEELKLRIEEIPHEIEERFKTEMDSLAKKNVELVQRNTTLEDQLNQTEVQLIDTRVKHAQLESERESLKWTLNELRKTLGNV